jgi:hypothetical protein
VHGGNLEMLMWLRSQDCPWDENVCTWAVRNENLEILMWLRSQDPPCPWNENICCVAMGIGNLEIMTWLSLQFNGNQILKAELLRRNKLPRKK